MQTSELCHTFAAIKLLINDLEAGRPPWVAVRSGFSATQELARELKSESLVNHGCESFTTSRADGATTGIYAGLPCDIVVQPIIQTIMER